MAMSTLSYDDTASQSELMGGFIYELGRQVRILLEESGKSESWNNKYVHGALFLLGYGAHGSVFQLSTRLYQQNSHKMNKERYTYHPDFLALYLSQRKMKSSQHADDQLQDRNRHSRLFDTVAIKYEMLEQSHLEDGVTRFHLFLRREFLLMDTLWRRFPRLLVGFPAVFDFGYIGNKQQYGLNLKYKDIFTYLNMKGEEVKFFADANNRNLEGVTKISYMVMELVGPSIEDYRQYFEPWYAKCGVKPFFEVATTFRIADQLLCRLYLLHRAGFVHHDIKPDNLAVGYGRSLNTIYLLDFGFAKQVGDNSVNEWMGSRKYISVDTYNGMKPNYAQDIESWFYVVMALLFDFLPWCDEIIEPLMSLGVEDGAKWAMAAAIKQTWWEEYSRAHTLHSMIEGVHKLHSKEVPDIRQIVQHLHKRVRELRAHLREIDDSSTLNTRLSNNQSAACRGYMSIRKVLLQIFDLPSIDKNNLLGDAEFKSYQAARQEQNLSPLKWEPNNFQWEWDRNHAQMLNSKRSPSGVDKVQLGSICRVPLNFQPKEAHNSAKVRRHLKLLLAKSSCQTRVRQKPLRCGQRLSDEASCVYDPVANCLVPKQPVRRTRPVESAAWDSGASARSATGEGNQLLLRQLANPSCLQ